MHINLLHRYKGLLTFGALALLTSACSEKNESAVAITKEAAVVQEQQVSSTVKNGVILKDVFKDSFMIGTALSRTQIFDEKPGVLSLVKEQFNTITPENVMKWERIHPSINNYDFAAADALVNFTQENNIFLVGHALVWHSQCPDWVFENADGSTISKADLLVRLDDHIKNVAGRYAGRIEAWDVLNEALNEDGTLRESKWLKNLGPEYIEHAFILAAKYAPNAKLYYNDYNLFLPEKRAGTVKLVKNLQDKGIKIDGVGIQGHYAIGYPDLNELEASIKAFAALNVDVMITELDVSVLPFPDEENQGADVSLNIALSNEFNPYPDALPADMQEQLGIRYFEIFEVLNRHKDSIGRVTFWGVDDSQTWRNDWPMKGRSDYTLPFDRQLKQKSFVADLINQ